MLAHFRTIARRCVSNQICPRIVKSYLTLFPCNNARKNSDPGVRPHMALRKRSNVLYRRFGMGSDRFYATDSSPNQVIKSNYIRQPFLKSIGQYLLWTPCLALSTVLALGLKPFPKLQYDTVTKLLVGSTKKIFNLEVIVEDRNKEYNDGPYLFCILNQNSLLEMIIYYASAPIRVKLIQNIEFTVIPFFGWISALLGSVTIIRQITFQARRGMAKVASTMRENTDSFVVSVEGRRSLDGNLSPFKKGPAIVAIESKARIIPVTLKNARDILPFGEWRINSGTVTVTLHEPIDTWSLTFADRDAVTNRMREIAEKELIKHNS